jgi:hypothetical protein
MNLVTYSEICTASYVESYVVNINQGFNARPGIVQYDIVADNTAADGGRTPTTSLTVSLTGYSFASNRYTFERTGELINYEDYEVFYEGAVIVDVVSEAHLVRDPGLLGQFAGVDGADITFSFELDGYYNKDRFVIDLVEATAKTDGNLIDTKDISVSGDAPGSVYAGWQDIAPSDDALYGPDGEAILDPVSGLVLRDGDVSLSGLAIRYVSSAAVAAANLDQVVRRGDAVAFDVTENDPEADGDAVLAARLIGVDAAHLDGDFANGDLVQGIDLETAFGDGNFIFYAAPDVIREVAFQYGAWDGEFESAPVDVVIDVIGLQPVASDDHIILAFDDATEFVSYRAILKNDYYTDALRFFDVLDSGPPLNPDHVVLRHGAAEGVRTATTDLVTIETKGLQLSAKVLAALRAAPSGVIGPDAGTLTHIVRYQVEDRDGSGISEQATVEITVAGRFGFADAAIADLSVQEDSSVVIDPLAGRTGGYGEAEIISVSSPVATGTDIVISTAEISDAAVIFTPAADLSDVTADIAVTLRDALGSEFVRTVSVHVTPTADAPVLRLLSPEAGSLSVGGSEDTPESGRLMIYDADALSPHAAGLGQTLTYLSLLSATPGDLDAASLALLAAAAPFLDTEASIRTANGGAFALSATANPLIYDYTYLSAQDDSGPDQVALAVTAPGEGEAEVFTLDVDIAPVNDAPAFAAAAPGADGPLIVDLGGATRFDLLAGAADVDGAIDIARLRIDQAPSASAADRSGPVRVSCGSIRPRPRRSRRWPSTPTAWSR